jgi:hypothetical protein
VIVLEANQQMHNAGAGDSMDGLNSIRKIGCDRFSRAGNRPRITPDKPEWLLPCCEKLDEFVAYRAACSENGDHSGPAFRK